MNLPGAIKHILYGALVIILQAALFNKLTMAGGIIDLVLLYLLFQCGQYTRTQSILMAALFGLLADATTDLWGLQLFSKVGTIYLFHPLLVRIQNNRFLLWQIALFLLLITLSHNTILLLVSLFTELYASEFSAVTTLISTTLFTVSFGLIYYLIARDR